jgi:hypothetical protein
MEQVSVTGGFGRRFCFGIEMGEEFGWNPVKGRSLAYAKGPFSGRSLRRAPLAQGRLFATPGLFITKPGYAQDDTV